MGDIFELLVEVRKKPELFIGDPSFTKLYHFINGYLFKSKMINTQEEEQFVDFVNWVMNCDDNEGWFCFIMKASNHHENDALNLFFDYFESYVKREDN